MRHLGDLESFLHVVGLSEVNGSRWVVLHFPAQILRWSPESFYVVLLFEGINQFVDEVGMRSGDEKIVNVEADYDKLV